MVLTAVRGALGFLTRLPVGRSERAWQALGTAPAVMVPAGYIVGGLAAIPVAAGVVLGVPAEPVALAYVVVLFAVTGIAHADGLADVGDALVVHGGPARRRDVMADTSLGVGGTVAVCLDVLGLALAALVLASAPLAVALGLVLAAEVGAKLAMVAVAVLGRPAHAGMGAHLADARPLQLAVAGGLVVPAAFATWPASTAAFALLAALGVALGMLTWARRHVGGATGDVFGATNELARLAALYAGVITWTLF